MKAYPDAGIVVLARVPEMGRIKTRLETQYSPRQVIEIYEAMVLDTFEILSHIREREAAVSVYWDGDFTASDFVQRSEERYGFASYSQVGRDLGKRIYNAMRQDASRGRARILALGCDSPTLPEEILLRAFDCLEDVPVVLGPAEDGGYYLIGLTRPRSDIFRSVEWGGPQVLEQTLCNLRQNGIPYQRLPAWWDVDRPEDLERLEREGSRAVHCAAVLKRIRR